MVRRLVQGFALFAALGLAHTGAALSVTLDPGGWISSFTDLAVESVFPPDIVASNPAGLPSSATTPGASAGPSAAVMDYTLDHDGFAIDFTQTVAASTGSGSQGTGYIYFTVDEDTTYLVSGLLDVVDSEGRGVYLRTFLEDITGAPFFLFQSEQYSQSTPNESFTIGLTEGDTSNLLSGSASGVLLAGHVYRFYADAALQSWPSAARTTTASASGNITLHLPEPSLALAVALALARLAALRSR